MNITFREYTDADYDLLLTLSNKLEEYAKSLDPLKRVQNNPGFAELSWKETLENVEKYQGKIWIAQDGDTIAGYVVGVIWNQSEQNKLEIGEHKLGEVIDLYLEESYRRKGLGTQMLEMMEKYFKDNGCDSMWISVFSPNIAAHNAYRKFGFVDREVGMLKNI